MNIVYSGFFLLEFYNSIADLPDSYLALDGIVTGNGNRIPLWLFGMMY